MKIEKLEDLLKIDTDKMKSVDKSRLLTRIKQLLKLEDKIEAKSDEEAMDLPYEGIGVVHNKLAIIKFDLASKKARVIEVMENTVVPVIQANAIQRLKVLIRTQKEVTNE